VDSLGFKEMDMFFGQLGATGICFFCGSLQIGFLLYAWSIGILLFGG